MARKAISASGSQESTKRLRTTDGQADISKGLMRARAVRELTGISLSETYRLCHAGTFQYRRLPGGRGMLIYRASVEQWLRDGLLKTGENFPEKH